MKNFLAGFLIAECTPMNLVLKPLLTFGFRFYVAYVFFKSGLSKVNDNFQVTSSTLSLFQDEYNVPLLPSDIAAYLATYAELCLPILLLIGFLSRPAALGLFILNAVAMLYVATTDFATIGLWQHTTWGAMIAVIFVFGPGKISLDKWISNKLYGRETNLVVTLVSIIVLGGIGYFLASKFL